MALGLKHVGFDIRAAFDIDDLAVQTYRHNIGHEGFVGDARTLSGRDLLRRAKLEKGTCGLFAGGPPCQGFSKQKRGAHKGDERNLLINEYIRLVGEIQPRFFLLENVDQFGKKRGATFVSSLASRLGRGGYDIWHHFFNSADYGVAQTRIRYIIVGRRAGVRTPFALPKPTHATRWRTIRDVIGDLPEPPEDFTDHPDFPNHQRARVTPPNILRFSHVPPGGGWRDIPRELRLPCHQADAVSGGWPDVYGRLRWDGQCPTITGGFDSFTRGRYGHPKHDRPLTPREAARIQGFPDTFVFQGTRAHIRAQIGNAVPPPLASAVGQAIKDSLEGKIGSESDSDPFIPMSQASLWDGVLSP